jgi:hypothetical protein
MPVWLVTSAGARNSDAAPHSLRSGFERDRRTRLFVCLAVDAVGLVTYAIPLFGEVFDVVWAPAAGLINWAVNGGWVGFLGGAATFGEEFAPGTDIIPSLTVTWFVVYVLGEETAFQQYAARRSPDQHGGVEAGDVLTIDNQAGTALTVWLEVRDLERRLRILGWTIPPGTSICPGAGNTPMLCDGTIRFCAKSSDGALAWSGSTIVQVGDEVYALSEIVVPRNPSGGYSLTLGWPDQPVRAMLPAAR